MSVRVRDILMEFNSLWNNSSTLRTVYHFLNANAFTYLYSKNNFILARFHSHSLDTFNK